MTEATVRKLVARSGEEASIGLSIHPHMLRHATGFYLANNGVDTRTFQPSSAIATSCTLCVPLRLAGGFIPSTSQARLWHRRGEDHPRGSGAGRAGLKDLLEVLVKGLRRAMHPLTHRRKGAQPLTFANEYDVQDLLHALLRPWVADIRPEEFTPSYAGSSTRMDLLLPAYRVVIETKVVRDRPHGKRVGEELIVDIDHYSKHPDCRMLWCVVYDPDHLVQNAEGLKADLEGTRTYNGVSFVVRVFVLSA